MTSRYWNGRHWVDRKVEVDIKPQTERQKANRELGPITVRVTDTHHVPVVTVDVTIPVDMSTSVRGDPRFDIDVPRCDGCGCEIDPDVCHCGDYVVDHNQGSGHGPVPMGCTCHLRTDPAIDVDGTNDAESDTNAPEEP